MIRDVAESAARAAETSAMGSAMMRAPAAADLVETVSVHPLAAAAVIASAVAAEIVLAAVAVAAEVVSAVALLAAAAFVAVAPLVARLCQHKSLAKAQAS